LVVAAELDGVGSPYLRIVSTTVARVSMRAATVTDTLEMATWARGRFGVTDLSGLIHHGDAGSRYVSLALTERLAALGTCPTMDDVGRLVRQPEPAHRPRRHLARQVRDQPPPS
jgi:transposase InsO family protein